MTDFQKRFRFVFLRFITVEILFTAVYSAVNCYFFIKSNWPQLDEDWTNVIIPLLISWIPVVIFILPRLKLFDFTYSKSKNPISGYVVLSIAAVTVTVITTQLFLTLSLSKLTQLGNINEVQQHPSTKYYQLNNHFINQRKFYVYHTRHVSGRHNTSLDFTDYFVCRIYAAAADTLKPNVTDTTCAWVGVSYYKSMSNDRPDSVKQEFAQNFEQENLDRFAQIPADQFVYLERLGRSNRQVNYLRAVNLAVDVNTCRPLVFETHNQPFDAHTGNSLWWMLIAFAGGCTVMLLAVNTPPLDNRKIEELMRSDSVV